MDRLVALRRVAMFKPLDIEDLETIADLAGERAYDEGEVIYREGEPGSEMLIIVRGRVRVSRVVDGHRHEIREMGEGEYVGELALLRQQPRAADVHAVTEVRGLSIDARSLQGLLNERPDVAIAMLASLAEQLGTQV